MISLPAKSKRLPANSFNPQWVEDLVYFEGPLLSYVKENSQQDYFYLWVDSDSFQNRWLAIPVSRDQIRHYKNKNLTLQQIILSNESVYFVDIGSDFKTTRSFSIKSSDLEDSVMPAHDSYFDSDLSPTGDMVLEDSTSHDLKLDGRWFFEDLMFVPRKYIQVYSFVYTFMNISKASVRENIRSIFTRYPWKGGGSRVNFYKDLSRVIPSMHEPRVECIQYASPGHIRLELLASAAERVGEISKICLQQVSELEDKVKEVNAFLKDNRLIDFSSDSPPLLTEQSNELMAMANELCGIMGLSAFQAEMISLTGSNPILYSKVLVSFDRRIRPLLEYMQKGMLSL